MDLPTAKAYYNVYLFLKNKIVKQYTLQVKGWF